MYVNTAICLSSFVNGIRNNANPFGSQYSAVLLLIALSYWHLKKA